MHPGQSNYDPQFGNFLIHSHAGIYFIVQFLLVCRCSFLQNNVTEKVLHLTRRKEKYLVVAAIRFVRTLLSVHVSRLFEPETIYFSHLK
jgi:hypothetical protein